MTEQALRCPFCSCRDLMMVESVYETGYFVLCLTCDACGPVAEYKEDALEKWENRLLYGEVKGLSFAGGD